MAKYNDFFLSISAIVFFFYAAALSQMESCGSGGRGGCPLITCRRFDPQLLPPGQDTDLQISPEGQAW